MLRVVSLKKISKKSFLLNIAYLIQKTIYLLLFCGYCTTFFAQKAAFYRQFDEKDGLSSNVITAICRDRQGYLWVGTDYGLNRYDGYTFRQYLPTQQGNRQSSVGHESIKDIKEDSEGFLWIATSEGLERYDPHRQTFRRWLNTGRDDGSLPNSLVTNLLADEKNKVWLCCDNRNLSYIDTQDFSFHSFDWKHFVIENVPYYKEKGYKSIYYLRRKSATELWLYTNIGVYVFDTQSQKFSHFSSDKNTDAYANTEGVVAPQYIEQDGTKWLGTERGLRYYAPQDQHFSHLAIYSKSNSLSQNPFSQTLFSKKYQRRYVSDFYQSKIFIYDKKDKLLKIIDLEGERTAILYEDSEGMIWTNSQQRLFRIHPKTLEYSPVKVNENLLSQGVAGSYFTAMCEDAKGNLWFAHDQQWLFIYDPVQQKWHKPVIDPELETYSASCLFRDVEKQQIWIGTQDYGVFCYDEKSQKFNTYRHSDNNPEHSILGYIVTAICKDSQGAIWVSTAPGGLTRLSPNKSDSLEIDVFNLKKGLPSNSVYSIVSDHSGNIWGATNRGLFYINTKTLQLRTFDEKQGLLNENINMPLSKIEDKRLTFSTLQGIQSFSPDSLLYENLTKKLLITQFKIFDKNYADTLNINDLQHIDLTWKESFFTFEFSALNFHLPEKNEYAYRLIGFDTDWVYCGKNHSAAYTNVPPGDYILEIKSGREGIFLEVGYRLSIHIEAPFWQKWWFKLLIISIIAAILYAAYRYRVVQIRKEEQLKTEFNQRLAKTEMAALRAQMNPHFVFNCLSSINRFILVNQPNEASAYLTKFSRLIRLILDNSRSENVSLDKELESLRLYIEMEAMRFRHRFEYNIDVAPNIPIDFIEIPPLLIQPYIENAIWHGLMHKEQGGHLEVKIHSKNENLLIIEIRDNGVGRVKAAELKSKSATHQKSHGMKVTAERIDLINQLYQVATQVTITDLYDPKGDALGTKVEITLNI